MKTISLLGLTALTTLALLSGPALAEQPRYTCSTGALTITSTSPCYVTTYGISVPGSGVDKEAKQGGDAGGKKGGGFDGPKDLKDKPKGGGLNGPNNIKDKD